MLYDKKEMQDLKIKNLGDILKKEQDGSKKFKGLFKKSKNENDLLKQEIMSLKDDMK